MVTVYGLTATTRGTGTLGGGAGIVITADQPLQTNNRETVTQLFQDSEHDILLKSCASIQRPNDIK